MAVASHRGAAASLAATGLMINGTATADPLSGGAFDDHLYGFAGDDQLLGLDGADLLDGGRGADRMEGGDGDDIYYVEDAGDRVVERADAGVDTVHAAIDFTLGAYLENLTLHAGALSGTGNALANVLIGTVRDNVLRGLQGNDTLIGDAGNDTLDGGRGIDRMEGGSGDDVFHVDNVGDQTIERMGEGTDTVHAGVSWSLDADIERLVLHGSARSATGNDFDNTLIGTSGDNSLTGGGGDDKLDAGAGDDTTFGWGGGAVVRLDVSELSLRDDGADVIDGGDGSDTYVVPTWFVSDSESSWSIRLGVIADLGDGTVAYVTPNTDAEQPSEDRLVSIENITTGFGDDRIVGSAAANRIACGGGVNVVQAGAGDDVIVGGNNAGGDDPGQTIAERLDGGAGDDTIYSGGSFWNYSDIRSDRHDFTTDLLSGGAGDDRLVGGLGDIRMTGGSGADIFEARCDVYLEANHSAEVAGLETTTTTITDFDPDEGDRMDFRIVATGVDDAFQKTKAPMPTYVGDTENVGLDQIGYTHQAHDGTTDTVISYRFADALPDGGEARPDLVFRIVLKDYAGPLGDAELLLV